MGQHGDRAPLAHEGRALLTGAELDRPTGRIDEAVRVAERVGEHELAVAAIAVLLGRPVKYCADRLESFVSDVHAREARIHGRLAPLKEPPMDPERLRRMIFEILDPRRAKIYRERNDVDFAYELTGIARFRVAAFRTRIGPAIVFRYIPEVVRPLSELGVPEVILKYTELNSGLILVTGPTGSGKTTTLYSVLKHLSRPEVNIVTIEDPIEMVHDEFNQVAVRPAIELTFANALRTVLRQDPDIIMVGEIRDRETAQIAVESALTGHLVLSTLHTNDAPSAITRLIEMGVEPFLVASSIECVLAQRLAAIDPRHGEVEENADDRLPMLADELDRLTSIARGPDGKAGP